MPQRTAGGFHVQAVRVASSSECTVATFALSVTIDSLICLTP